MSHKKAFALIFAINVVMVSAFALGAATNRIAFYPAGPLVILALLVTNFTILRRRRPAEKPSVEQAKKAVRSLRRLGYMYIASLLLGSINIWKQLHWLALLPIAFVLMLVVYCFLGARRLEKSYPLSIESQPSPTPRGSSV